MIFDCSFKTLISATSSGLSKHWHQERNTNESMENFTQKFCMFWDEIMRSHRISIRTSDWYWQGLWYSGQSRLLIILTEAWSCPWSSISGVLSSFSTNSSLTNNWILTASSDWTTVGWFLDATVSQVIAFSLCQSVQWEQSNLPDWHLVYILPCCPPELPSNRVMIIADGDADSGVDESTQAAEQAADTTEPAKRPTTSRIPR